MNDPTQPDEHAAAHARIGDENLSAARREYELVAHLVDDVPGGHGLDRFGDLPVSVDAQRRGHRVLHDHQEAGWRRTFEGDVIEHDGMTYRWSEQLGYVTIPADDPQTQQAHDEGDAVLPAWRLAVVQSGVADIEGGVRWLAEVDPEAATRVAVEVIDIMADFLGDRRDAGLPEDAVVAVLSKLVDLLDDPRTEAADRLRRAWKDLS